jgi:hypothetical protein
MTPSWIALTELLKLQKSGQFPYEPVRIKLQSTSKNQKRFTKKKSNFLFAMKPGEPRL